MTAGAFHMLGIAGGLRRGSFNRSLLRTAQEIAPAWTRIHLFDVGRLPFFKEDTEAEGDPEMVRVFKDRIAAWNTSRGVPEETPAQSRQGGRPSP